MAAGKIEKIIEVQKLSHFIYEVKNIFDINIDIYTLVPSKDVYYFNFASIYLQEKEKFLNMGFEEETRFLKVKFLDTGMYQLYEEFIEKMGNFWMCTNTDFDNIERIDVIIGRCLIPTSWIPGEPANKRFFDFNFNYINNSMKKFMSYLNREQILDFLKMSDDFYKFMLDGNYDKKEILESYNIDTTIYRYGKNIDISETHQVWPIWKGFITYTPFIIKLSTIDSKDYKFKINEFGDYLTADLLIKEQYPDEPFIMEDGHLRDMVDENNFNQELKDAVNLARKNKLADVMNDPDSQTRYNTLTNISNEFIQKEKELFAYLETINN